MCVKYTLKNATGEEQKMFDAYSDMMYRKIQTVLNGWMNFDMLGDVKIALFIYSLLANRDEEAICRFEADVFLHGNDLKTYIHRQVVVESSSTIELSDEIMNKETRLLGEPNCGGVEGHDGCHASTSYTSHDGLRPPPVFLEFIKHNKELDDNKMSELKALVQSIN